MKVIFIYLSLTFLYFNISNAQTIHTEVLPRKNSGKTIAGEFIIEVKKGVINLGQEKGIIPAEKISINSESLQKLNQEYNLIRIEKLFSGTRKDIPSDIYVFKFPENTNVNKLMSVYEKDPNVLYLETNYTVRTKTD